MQFEDVFLLRDMCFELTQWLQPSDIDSLLLLNKNIHRVVKQIINRHIRNENSVLRQQYVNDVQHGLSVQSQWVFQYTDLRTISLWKNGKRHGPTTSYNKSGVIICKELYHEDEIMSKLVWHRNGIQVWIDADWKKGILRYEKRYHADGSIHYLHQLDENGELHGIQMVPYRDEKSHVCNYHHGTHVSCFLQE